VKFKGERMRILGGSIRAVSTFLFFVGLVCAYSFPLNPASLNPDIPADETPARHLSSKDKVRLAAAYWNGDGVPRNEKLAAYWYEKAAQTGDPGAQNEIGYFYQVGIGVPVNPERAVYWYRLASASGLPLAKVNLGVAYLWGTGTAKDLSVSQQLFREAVSKGSGVGAAYLGDMYYFGLGVETDRNQALHWYTIGAKLHDPIAECNLATLFFVSSDRSEDLSKAASLFRDSASGGYTPAMHSLGVLLVKNPDLAKSPGEPRQLLEKAADAGNWRSALMLGVLARDGRGTPRDEAAAYRYFREAALEGGDAAFQMVHHDLELLSANLGDEAAKRLDAEAEDWLQRHPRSVEFVFEHNNRLFGRAEFSLTNPNARLHAGTLIPKASTASISVEPM
jgi:hypothetical protein